MALKIKIKKNTLVRKIDGVKKTGYYGKVIANGTKSFEDIVKQSTHGSTLDYREAELACKMMIDGIADSIKQGYIVDLGVLGKLYPAVNGKWDENADNLQLADMKPKVNYKAGDDIAAAVKGASLSWTMSLARASSVRSIFKSKPPPRFQPINRLAYASFQTTLR